MKIETQNINSFITNILNSQIKIALIYGSEEAVVSFRIEAMLKQFKNNKIDLVEVQPIDIKNNSGILIQELTAISMFSEKTCLVLRLKERENDYTKYINELLKQLPKNNNNFFLIAGGELAKTSSLRKLSEESELMVSIPCYEETEKSIKLLINTKLKEAGFLYRGDVVDYLYNSIGSNLLIVQREIEKIILYKGLDKNLKIEDLTDLIMNISENNVGDFINEFMSLNKKDTFVILNKLFDSNIVPIILIRSLIYSFLQLQRVQFLLKNDSLEIVMKKERIFWKQEIFIKDHLKKWSLKKITLFLEKLVDVEKEIKFSQNYKVELENFILKSLLIFK